MTRPHSGLDGLSLRGRLKSHAVRRPSYERRTAPSYSRIITDISVPKPAGAPNRPAPVIKQANLSNTKPQSGMGAQSIAAPRVMSDVIKQPKKPAKRPQPAGHLHPVHMPSKVLRREGVLPAGTARAVQPVTPQASPGIKRHVTVSRVITFIAGVVIIAGVWIGFSGMRANQEVEATTKRLNEQSTDNGTSNVPTEGDKPNTSSYRVAAMLPRTISIPKYDVHARVVRLGIRANNQLAAPANIYDAGWYDASSKPGEGGAMLIDGHVSGPTKHGVFYDLKKVGAGDLIKVERGDGKLYTYKVVRTKSYPANAVDMAAALTAVTPGKPGLNLITCDGALDASRNHYQDRLVVFAEQI